MVTKILIFVLMGLMFYPLWLGVVGVGMLIGSIIMPTVAGSRIAFIGSNAIVIWWFVGSFQEVYHLYKTKTSPT